MRGLFQPLYLDPSAVKNIPRGWRLERVEDVTVLLNPGKLFDENSVVPEGLVPVLNQTADSYHGYHNEEPGVNASKENPVSTFANHTCAMRLMKQPFSCIQNIFPRVGKDGICDTIFFHYAMLGRVQLSGYKGHHPIFRKAIIPLPDMATQRRIASILSAYDNLIENNLRRIKLLEESARQLYKEWFVRLRFPGYEHVKIRNGMPEGWEKKRFGDLCKEIREIVMPKSVEPDMPYIGLEHMPRKSITLSTWGKAEEVTSSKHRFIADDVIFGKIRPYFHKVGFALEDGIASSDAIVIRATDDSYKWLILMVVSSDQFVADSAQRMKEGSKMPRADWTQMKEYPVPLPSFGLLRTFNDSMQPITRQLRTLAMGNRKLSEARDILLPKLMSGEVEV